MRWIRTANGEKAHAVLSGNLHTLCGVAVASAQGIVGPTDQVERCESCDHEWRRRGRRGRQRNQPVKAGEYRPRFTIKDWEDQ